MYRLCRQVGAFLESLNDFWFLQMKAARFFMQCNRVSSQTKMAKENFQHRGTIIPCVSRTSSRMVGRKEESTRRNRSATAATNKVWTNPDVFHIFDIHSWEIFERDTWKLSIIANEEYMIPKEQFQALSDERRIYASETGSCIVRPSRERTFTQTSRPTGTNTRIVGTWSIFQVEFTYGQLNTRLRKL